MPSPARRANHTLSSFEPLGEDAPAAGQSSDVLLAWLHQGRHAGASDLHLKPDVPPRLRLRGALVPIEGAPVLDGHAISEMMKSLVADKADWSEFMLGRHELDLGLEFPDVGRLRIN